MFEKPRLETFSCFLAPSIDNSHRPRREPPLRAAREAGYIICSIFHRAREREISATRNFSELFPSSLASAVATRKDVPWECTLTITGPLRAFIARLGGAHTTAILLAAIKY